MNISEYIVDFLSKKGITDVFSIVGGHSLFINKAFHDHPDYKVTYMHHEQTASMAADAYFRLKNIPAIVNISAGPASLNTLNGLYGSYVDSIPTIYISGQPKSNQQVSHTGLSLRPDHQDTIPLCPEHHNMGNESIHHNKKLFEKKFDTRYRVSHET